MKVCASYILHYGVEWLYWSVRSVIDFVDGVYFFYTPTPSHGQSTDLPNPETREDLLACLSPFMAKKYNIKWFDCTDGFVHEGFHREFAVNTCASDGADMVFVVDADEIWHPDSLDYNLRAAEFDDRNRTFRVGMRHFWRSLRWVCDDAAMPTRIIKPQVEDGEAYLNGRKSVYHMGYAQTPDIIQYKMSIHGHKNELRPGWFENTFMPWKPGMGDVHPTNVDFWDPRPYVDDELKTLEYLVGDHPFWNKDIIR